MSPRMFRDMDGTLGPPPGMEATVYHLAMRRVCDTAGTPLVQSVWRPTPCERLLLAYGRGDVSLYVVGHTMPPVHLAVEVVP